jgi:hypothetical protein
VSRGAPSQGDGRYDVVAITAREPSKLHSNPNVLKIKTSGN